MSEHLPLMPNQPASTTEIQQAVAKLSQSPGWQHLDVGWIDAVTLATADGPEMNVDVSVVSSDGQPLAGAVVAIQESIFEAEPRVSLIRRTVSDRSCCCCDPG